MKRRNLPRPLAALVAAGICAALLGACGGSSKASSTRSSTGAAAAAALNAPGELNPPTPAADFALRDSRGELVRLSQYRGKAVLLTFIYSHCPDVCPLIVSQLRNALLRLGSQSSRVQVVGVSVDPKGDGSKAVNAFLAARDMTGRMEFLIGSKEQLAPVWKAYGIQVEATPALVVDAKLPYPDLCARRRSTIPHFERWTSSITKPTPGR